MFNKRDVLSKTRGLRGRCKRKWHCKSMMRQEQRRTTRISVESLCRLQFGFLFLCPAEFLKKILLITVKITVLVDQQDTAVALAYFQRKIQKQVTRVLNAGGLQGITYRKGRGWNPPPPFQNMKPRAIAQNVTLARSEKHPYPTLDSSSSLLLQTRIQMCNRPSICEFKRFRCMTKLPFPVRKSLLGCSQI